MASFDEILEVIENKSREGAKWREQQDERFTLLEEHITKSQRPGFDASTSGSNSTETKALADGYKALLQGKQEKATELFVQAKAMQAGSDPDGGYVVHPLISTGMVKVMSEVSPIYRLARRVPIPSGSSFEEPVDRQELDATWVSETAARPETTSPQLAMYTIPLDEIYTMPAVSQKLVDTASIDVVQWLNGKIAESFAAKESIAFHTGNGVGKPRGILSYTTAATSDATRTWGVLQHVPTGAAGAFHTTKTDPLFDVVSSLKSQYRDGAVWLMNSRTAATVRKLKEATSDRYLWEPAMQLGQPNMLLGHAVEIDEHMPDIAADSLSIAFGNIKRAFTVVEMPGIRMLTDPYTAKPYIRLFAYRRVGAAVSNFEALKYLRFSAA